MQKIYFDMRKSGIPLIGDLPWGSHFCQFYQTEKDLLEILVPYFKAGIEGNELCIWITSGLFSVEEASNVLKKALPDFKDYIDKGQMEMIPEGRWSVQGEKTGETIVSKLDKAISSGFDGLRLACNPSPEKGGEKASAFVDPDVIGRYNIIAFYSYLRENFDTAGLMKVMQNHRLALVWNLGQLELIESSEVRVVKDALKRSEEKLQSLFSNMSEGFAYHRIVLNAEGKPCDYIFYQVNEAFEKLTNLKRENIIGKRVTKVLPGIENDPTNWIGKFGEVALTGKPVQFEVYDVPARKWFSVSAFSPHKGFFAVTFSDITERKRSEKAVKEAHDALNLKVKERTANLARSNTKLRKEIEERKQAEKATRIATERYELAVAGSSDTIWDWDISANTIYYSDRFNEVMGYDFNEVPKTIDAFYSLLHPKDTESIRTAMERHLKGGIPYSIEHRLKTKSGEYRWFLARGQAIWDKKGNATRMSGSLQDITERRRLEAQLFQSQKMEAIGRLAGGVAHDFNNLLTLITGYAKFALDELKEDTPVYDNVKEILEAGQLATSLTRHLLAFSRKQVIQPKILNLNDILKGTEKILRRLIGEDINLTSIFASELWNIYMDPGQMEQVLMNLAVNARDAMPSGGKLTVETNNIFLGENYFLNHGVENKLGQYVMLTVTDNGVGMDEETCFHIFEPFYTTKNRDKGTGLGLSTVYGIVKQNKGFVWVYSEPGKGTSFKVYLPASEEDVRHIDKQEKIPKDMLNGNETILLVEDDEKLLRLAQKNLKSYEYNVLSTSNSDEAMKISDEYEGTIHFLLTDVIMPGMSGKELAIKIETQRPEIKILYMSGYAENVISHHGILDKNINFIQKPFSPGDLVRKIRKVLDQGVDRIRPK